jgi:hypothetical protein
MRRGTRKGESAVARAVAILGGPTKAARICRVSNAAVHKWINRRSVPLLKHALLLSKASEIPIEEFVGDDDDQA